MQKKNNAGFVADFMSFTAEAINRIIYACNYGTAQPLHIWWPEFGTYRGKEIVKPYGCAPGFMNKGKGIGGFFLSIDPWNSMAIQTILLLLLYNQ